MSKKKPVTMQTIAEVAGVSKMTVSRALKDHPKQSEKTKLRIREIAESMGYQIHPYVSALMGHRASTRAVSDVIKLALFHFEDEEITRRHPYFTGIEERARQLGYQIDLFPYAPDQVSEERLKRILHTRGIRGIILMPSPHGFAHLKFDFEGFATVAMGHSILEPALPRVGSDPQASVFKTLDELTQLGYRRIGLVNTDYVNKLSRFLYSGAFHAYQKHRGRDLHLSELRLPTNVAETELPRMRRWVDRFRPEVIISSSFSIDIHRMLTEMMNLRIPQEMGYVHLLRYFEPHISHIDPHEKDMGRKAADLVIAAINHNDFTPTSFPYVVATAPEWIPGATVKKINRSTSAKSVAD